MQRLQNHALRVIFHQDGEVSTDALLKKGNLFPLQQRADTQLILLMYRRSLDPKKYPTLTALRDTRPTEKIKFKIPTPRTKTFKNLPLY